MLLSRPAVSFVRLCLVYTSVKSRELRTSCVFVQVQIAGSSRPEHTFQRLLIQLGQHGTYIACCHPESILLGQDIAARTDSQQQQQQQQQQQTVQEPVLLLTTSNLVVLSSYSELVCTIPLQGMTLLPNSGYYLLCYLRTVLQERVTASC